MKLLIIAGPYEADRIRKAAVAAGFETLAVEPGESLSGWINASRPDLIVMAPQIVHADPALALAKVRTTPRGRVPVFLVGDAGDEEHMRSLAEGFFVRPIAPDVLLAQARAILTPKSAQPDFERTEMGMGSSGGSSPKSGLHPGPSSGPKSGPKSGLTSGLKSGLRPGPKSGPKSGKLPQPDFERTEMGVGSSMPALKPLVAAALASSTVPPAKSGDSGRLLAELSAGIDALLEAELESALPKMPPPPAPPPPEPLPPPPEFTGETTKKFDGSVPVDAARPSRKKPKQAAKTGEASKYTGSTSPGMPSAAPPEDARARVLRRHALVQDGDYFAVLGVGHDATPEELQSAHANILSELSAPGVSNGLAEDLSDQIAEIREVAEEALRVLGDPSLRTRYASHLS